MWSHLISWHGVNLHWTPLTAVPDNWQGSGLTNSCALQGGWELCCDWSEPHHPASDWSAETQHSAHLIVPHCLWLTLYLGKSKPHMNQDSEMLDLASDDQDCKAQDAFIIKGFTSILDWSFTIFCLKLSITFDLYVVALK